MNSKEIIIDNFNVLELYKVYDCSKLALGHPSVTERLVLLETLTFIGLAEKMSPELGPVSQDKTKALEASTAEVVAGLIGRSLDIIRQQMLAAAFNLFDNYLSHVLRTYLYHYPQFLKSSDGKVCYREIVDHCESDHMLDYIIEREAKRFSYLSIVDKKKYLSRRLGIDKDGSLVWRLEGRDWWRDLDRKRQSIVHGEAPEEVDEDSLLCAIEDIWRAIILIAIICYRDYKIPFILNGQNGVDVLLRLKKLSEKDAS